MFLLYFGLFCWIVCLLGFVLLVVVFQGVGEGVSSNNWGVMLLVDTPVNPLNQMWVRVLHMVCNPSHYVSSYVPCTFEWVVRLVAYDSPVILRDPYSIKSPNTHRKTKRTPSLFSKRAFSFGISRGSLEVNRISCNMDSLSSARSICYFSLLVLKGNLSLDIFS